MNLTLRHLIVSADFLRTLSVPLQLGREFTADESRAGGPPAVILNDAIWRNVFAADRGRLGARSR